MNFINPPNINDIINKKQKFNHFDLSSDNIINDIKLDIINKIIDMNIKLKGSELKKWITDFNNNLSNIIKSFDTDKKIINIFKNNINQLIIIKLQLSLFIEILKEIKINKTFNLNKYLNTYKKQLSNEKQLFNENQPKKKIKVDDKSYDDNNEDEYNDNDEDNNDEDDNDDDDDDNDDDDDDNDDDDNDDDDNNDDDNYYIKKPYNKHHTELVNELNKTKKVDNNNIIYSYFEKLNNKEKNLTLKNLKEVNNYQLTDIPSLFKIISLDLQLSQKNYILKKYLSLLSSHFDSNKLKAWIDAVLTLPIGNYTSLNFKSSKHTEIKSFLDNLDKIMNNAVWGHDDAKRQIIQIIGQQIRNPNSKGNMIGIWGPPGNGKCFAFNTPILMYNGTIKMVQDIIIGDIIMGDDSTPRNVLSLGNGQDQMYEILSNNGDSYIVNSEHILCLKSVGYNKIIKTKSESDQYIVKFLSQYLMEDNTFNIYENTKTFDTYQNAKEFYNSLDNIIEITVKNYLKLKNYIKYKLRGYKTGVEFIHKDTEIDPYVVGLTYGNELNKNVIDNISDFIINSRDTRLKFLAGIIDYHGEFNNTTNKIEINYTDKSIVDNIILLARSLGFNAYQYDIIKPNFSKYRIEIYSNNITEIPTLNITLKNSKYKNNLLNKITVIKKNYDNYYGFTLDGNNRFLLGDFIVTHNTTLIKEGIAKALNKPFVFISLGGASDASFLEGHSYTYEGSIYGRIAAGLITSKCMDPIFYFDELDKISNTPKGQEITNLLIHLTDPVQNSHFRDKYFHGIDIDLSRATMIFSFNDPSNVNHILLDRITTVETKFAGKEN